MRYSATQSRRHEMQNDRHALLTSMPQYTQPRRPKKTSTPAYPCFAAAPLSPIQKAKPLLNKAHPPSVCEHRRTRGVEQSPAHKQTTSMLRGPNPTPELSRASLSLSPPYSPLTLGEVDRERDPPDLARCCAAYHHHRRRRRRRRHCRHTRVANRRQEDGVTERGKEAMLHKREREGESNLVGARPHRTSFKVVFFSSNKQRPLITTAEEEEEEEEEDPRRLARSSHDDALGNRGRPANATTVLSGTCSARVRQHG